MSAYGPAFSSAVAAELRAERGRKQVTVAALVEGTGLSKSAVLYYLKGKRDIPTAALGNMCAALGLPVSVLTARAEAALGDS